MGNLQPYQGIGLLLAGFARTLAEVPAAKLIVVGGSPDEIDRYHREAAASRLAAAVHFAGPRPVEALGACLRRATVLVSPRTQGGGSALDVTYEVVLPGPEVAVALLTELSRIEGVQSVELKE